MDDLDELLKKAVHEIKSNHDKIIDDWCKAYLAQRYKEGKSIDVGCFTLCQQNLSWTPGEVGYKYWFIDGIPDYPKSDGWISVKDKLPDYGEDVLFVNGKNHVSVGERLPYEEGTDIWSSDESIYFSDHMLQELVVCKFWMSLPQPPSL